MEIGEFAHGSAVLKSRSLLTSIARIGVLLAAVLLAGSAFPESVVSAPISNPDSSDGNESVERKTGASIPSSDSGNTEAEVIVRASGVDFRTAREEAVRTALQSVVEQLVISDRLIDNGEVVRDEVLSTQNGFITGFEVLEQRRTEFGEVEIQARVGISRDTILNYAGLRGFASSEVDGSALFAEVNRRADQTAVFRQMLGRFLAGYPWDVLSVELDSIAPAVGLDGVLEARIKIETDPRFLTALEQFAERISALEYRTTFNLPRLRYSFPVERVLGGTARRAADWRNFRPGEAWYPSALDSSLQVPNAYPSTQVCTSPGLPLDANGENRSSGAQGHCHLFPPGDFVPSSWRDPSGHSYLERFALLVSFVDRAGVSQVVNDRHGGCFVLRPSTAHTPWAGTFYMNPRDNSGAMRPSLPALTGGSGLTAQGLSSLVFIGGSRVFEARLASSDADFSAVERFVGRVVLLSHDGRIATKEPGGTTFDLRESCSEMLTARNDSSIE